jgi:hypothetical protein
VYAALRTTEAERWEIRQGMRPLMLPSSNSDAQIALLAPATATDPWQVARDLVTKFGPGLVFDEVIMPAIS